MSSELERRLDDLLLEAPEPETDVGERALARALHALELPVVRPRRRLRVVAALVAAALALLALAAGSLAAAGALHVSFGQVREHAGPRTLILPGGTAGIAAVVNGRLSVVTRSGFRLQGLPVSAAALSPHALYVAAGIGTSLVALKPDGRRAWSHPAGGTVVTIAWAPDGLRIAYVVRTARRLVLRTIWGNGTHDAAIDRSVRAVRPSWRADSLAFAYVAAGGRAVVYDVGHRSRSVVPNSPAGVSEVAFAPAGKRLALLDGRTIVVGKTRSRARIRLVGIGWVGGELAFVSRGGQAEPVRIPGPIVSFVASGSTFAAVVGGEEPRVVAGTTGNVATVLALPRGARVEAVAVR